ncbi:uncharacterized protein LOC129754266 [Uranotaenia lowii]|uniref:uncharacterized protein LOC129754266 n=1 Tax=Uranotaenia lowii TaxID=190385 RepID=UPI00247A4B5D|nr:uncharacterized protein LOC129754266 [Uranotaenia lowii]
MGKPKRSKQDLDTSEEFTDTSNLLDRIQRMIDAAISQVLLKISETKTEIQSEITTLRDELSEYKQKCSKSIRSVQEELKLTQEKMLHLAKSNDLIITGIPFQPNEKLGDTIRKVSLALGFADSELPLVSAKRLSRSPIQESSSPPILVEFAFKSVRNEFFGRYLKKRSLALTHIDINVNRRIYINENLSESTRKLKGELLKLKRSGSIQSVFTKDGLVFVKTSVEKTPKLITSIDQVDC